jgi:hypothetical protein
MPREPELAHLAALISTLSTSEVLFQCLTSQARKQGRPT